MMRWIFLKDNKIKPILFECAQIVFNIILMALDMYIYGVFPASNEGGGHWKNRPLTEREAGSEIMIRLSQQFLELLIISIETS